MIDFEILWELFRHSVFALLVVGAGVPLVGAFLFVRRAGFQGIVLPQCATTGVAVGYWALPTWFGWFGNDQSLPELLSDPHNLEGYLQVWAIAGAFAGSLTSLVTRRNRGAESAWLAAIFTLSIGATVSLRSRLPLAGEAIDALLGGEVILIDEHGLLIVAVAVLVSIAMVLALRKPLLLGVVSPELAAMNRRRRTLSELGLVLATTLVVGACVSIVGPYATLAALVVAPLAAHRLARSLRSFLWLSSAFGLLAAIGGVWLSFGPLDFPLGPAVVLASGVTLAPHAIPARQ